MKRLITSLFFICLLLPGVCLSSKTTQQPYRTWTSFTGSTIEAKLTNRTSENSVTLKKKDGTTLFIDYRQLSAGDQEYLNGTRLFGMLKTGRRRCST